MSLSLALGTASLVLGILNRTSLSSRLGTLLGRDLTVGDRAWLSAISTFHDVGSLVNDCPLPHAGLANVLRGRASASIRPSLQRWFGTNPDHAVQALRAVTSFKGVVQEEHTAARISSAAEHAILDLTDRLDSLFHGRPFAMTADMASLFAGVVALARQLAEGTFHGSTDWPSLQGMAHERIGSLGLDPRTVAWPTSSSDQPLHSGITVVESRMTAERINDVLQRGFALIHAGKVDNIILACRTRSSVIEAFEAIHVPGVQTIRGLPWDFEPECWFTEPRWRYGFAPICVTTQEQAFNAYRLEQHAPMRAAALARAFLVLDDVYTSDFRQNALVRVLAGRSAACGGHVLLTSAVLDATSRSRLFFERWPNGTPDEEVAAVQEATSEADMQRASRDPYPCVWDAPRAGAVSSQAGHARSDRVSVSFLDSGAEVNVARRAIGLLKEGARVLVVRTLRRECLSTALAIEELLPGSLLRVNNRPTLLHVQYTPEDRHEIDHAARTGREPCILLGTPHVECGMPFNADVLVTDFCPIDVLIRRASRIRGSAIHVVRPRRGAVVGEAFVGLIGRNGKARYGEHGVGRIYKNLAALSSTLTSLEAQPHVLDRGLPREDIELALHPFREQVGHEWDRHRAWLGRLQAEYTAVADSLRGGATGLPFGERDCDVTSVHHRERRLYPEGEPEMTVYFPRGTRSPLGSMMRVLVVKRRGDLPSSSVEPVPDGDGWRFGNGHIYDSYGYRYQGDDDEDD